MTILNNIRLHLLAIPYTITLDEYSHDAFTGKVKRFSPMMRSRGFEVFHYGVETSESGANQNIELMTKNEWLDLRIDTIQWLYPHLSIEECVKKNTDSTFTVSELSNWSSPLCIEFNRRLRVKLKENYRGNTTDIVCVPLGKIHNDAIHNMNYVIVEFGIGYSHSYHNYRVFESNAWLSCTIGKESVNNDNKGTNNYDFVIPHYFDINQFKLNMNPNPLQIGFLGRLCTGKGCHIISDIASKFPTIQFILCGSGDPTSFLTRPNIIYKSPIHGNDRSDYLGNCIAVLCLTTYFEPFNCACVESQLCGTPVISSDFGGMVETIKQFKTGLKGHTLSDYCYGIQMAINGKFDRKYIRDRAVKKYNMYKLAYNYEYVFKSVNDIHTTKNGWYSPDSHIISLNNDNDIIQSTQNQLCTKKPRIYIFLPYYGSFLNYFQLYLDSLQLNKDILTIFLITDNDISVYNIPENLILIPLPIQKIKIRISDFILTTYGKYIHPDELLKSNYKLVDCKIIYPVLFDDIIQTYNILNTDYVGWGDCDLIYGKISTFINFKNDFEIIGGWHGHFVAIKNTVSFKNSFLNIPNYFDLLIDSTVHITDEIAYRDPLINYLKENNYQMFYTNKYFCDIVPDCFVNMYRPNYLSLYKNFFDVYNTITNISYLYYDKINSKLMVNYDNGEIKEVMYCHLQKRKMILPNLKLNNEYYIYENCFTSENKSIPIIPLKIWQTYNTKKLPYYMNRCVEHLKKNHPNFEHNLFDDDECKIFIQNHFPVEVLIAYESLIPGAYKADLWKLCILYIYGGIYIDIKLQFCNNYNLTYLIDKEQFVFDGTYLDNDIQRTSIYNALMICQQNNPILLKTIIQIVYNISNNYYGHSPYCVTGPQLVGKIYDNEHKNKPYIELIHYGPIGDETIKNSNNIVICDHYKQYIIDNTKNYVNDWNDKKIYNEKQMELIKIKDTDNWSKQFLHLLNIPVKIFNHSNITIILTSTVNVNTNISCLHQTNSIDRIQTYLKSVLNWLYNTNFNIVLVENSGYNFDELEKEKILFKHRFEVIVFNEKNVNESIFINEGTGIHELFAINYAFNHSILLPSSFFIIKITARFYIPDFEEYLSTYNLTNYDCIVQNDRNRCELVGCKYKYFSHIFSMCINNNYIESEYKNKTSIYKNILICKLFTIDATQRGGVNQIYTTI